MLMQQVLDDFAIDLPDLLSPPDRTYSETPLRVRLMDERPIAPHSPSLKRRPKPPRVSTLPA
ncbi:hypothetical protein [Diaphorobacter aerolatus]|uniref:Uncharacterized protein n=1 Tax=Diaphorobacter aerolatus TaxID=1288495 RepID=A0A7H0GK70_9BURK|nr:hypothetical protein [Diaphorobacter aerolatus]QNP48686.1 hypothetical protein H9K75_23095 [Diaphorobacter aerolatus]